MINQYSFVRPPVPALIIAMLLCLSTVLAFSGCRKEEQPELPEQPTIVYDDGVSRAELISLERLEDGVHCTLTLRFTNNSLEDIALSSVLGMSVTADGQPCELVPAKGTPIDGLVTAGSSREGSLTFSLPEQAQSVKVAMAVDYTDDKWIEFEVNL